MVVALRIFMWPRFCYKNLYQLFLAAQNEHLSALAVARMATRTCNPVDSMTNQVDGEHVAETDDAKRPQFGNRFLLDPKKVFEHNAWDDVIWDEEQEKQAAQKVAENSSVLVRDTMRVKYEDSASQFWDDFYGVHQNRFFKDRKWLFTEFAELASAGTTGEQFTSGKHTPTESEAYPGEKAKMRILEMGCGVGNTVFPILETNNDPNLFVYCCDFSGTAVNLVKENPDYDINRCYAFVCDMTADVWLVPFPENSLDVVILIFVLSAIHPHKMKQVAQQIKKYLKPGGIVVFRDYGRFDMAQLRFKKGRCLSENFYVRGDGTRVYFFTPEEVNAIFTSVGLKEELNMVDRRLQVNRGKLLKMYRVWIQAKFRKAAIESIS